MSAKVYGAATFSATGLTGAILNDFTIEASSGTPKTLMGNPGDTVEDVRTGPANAETMTVNCAFPTGSYVEPDTMIGDTVTLTATSEDTDAATITGLVTNASCKGSKDDWWVYSLTVVKVPA